MKDQVQNQSQSSFKDQNPELAEKFKSVMDQAKQLLYGDNFDNMVNVFKQGGREGFADAMATVVIGTMDRLEQDNGQLDPQMLVMVALGMVAMLASDMGEGGVVEGLVADDVQVAMGMVVSKWMESNEDRAEVPRALEMMQKQAMQRKQGAGGQMEEKGMLSEQRNTSGFGGV